MLYQAVVKELVGLPNVGLVVSLYFVQDCSSVLRYSRTTKGLLFLEDKQGQGGPGSAL